MVGCNKHSNQAFNILILRKEKKTLNVVTGSHAYIKVEITFRIFYEILNINA